MLSYSVGSSHRISMAFHQSKITFSFDLISSSLEKQNKYHLLTDLVRSIHVHQGCGLRFPCSDQTGTIQQKPAAVIFHICLHALWPSSSLILNAHTKEVSICQFILQLLKFQLLKIYVFSAAQICPSQNILVIHTSPICAYTYAYNPSNFFASAQLV